MLLQNPLKITQLLNHKLKSDCLSHLSSNSNNFRLFKFNNLLRCILSFIFKKVLQNELPKICKPTHVHAIKTHPSLIRRNFYSIDVASILKPNDLIKLTLSSSFVEQIFSPVHQLITLFIKQPIIKSLTFSIINYCLSISPIRKLNSIIELKLWRLIKNYRVRKF